MNSKRRGSSEFDHQAKEECMRLCRGEHKSTRNYGIALSVLAGRSIFWSNLKSVYTWLVSSVFLLLLVLVFFQYFQYFQCFSIFVYFFAIYHFHSSQK